MTKIEKPVAVPDIDFAFPAHVIGKYLPLWEDIPAEFKKNNDCHPYHRLAQDWFFTGLKNLKLECRPGIDQSAALRHLQTIMRSYEPKHEHKIAGVAYLIDIFYSKFEAA